MKAQLRASWLTVFLPVVAAVSGGFRLEASWTETPAPHPGQQVTSVDRDPRLIALDTASGTVLLGHEKTGRISRVALDSGEVLGSVLVDDPPEVIVADGGRAYFGLGDGAILVLDASSGDVLARWEVADGIEDLLVVRGGAELLVADEDEERLVRVSTTDGAVFERIPLDDEPEWMAFVPAIETVLVGEDQLQFVELVSSEVVPGPSVGGEVEALAYWQAGGLAVAIVEDDRVCLLSVAGAAIVANLPLGFSAESLVADETRGRAYVIAEDEPSIGVIDLEHRELLGVYAIPSRGDELVLTPSDEALLVTLPQADELLRLDLDDGLVSSTVAVEDSVRDLAVDDVGGQAVLVGPSKKLQLLRLEDRVVEAHRLPMTPKAVAVDEVRRLALLGASSSHESLWFYDLDARAVVGDPLALPGGVRAIAVDARRGLAVVIDRGKHRLHIVDIDGRFVAGWFRWKPNLLDVAVDSERGRAFALSDRDRSSDKASLLVIDLETRELETLATLSSDPTEVEVDASLGLAVVTHPKRDGLSLVGLDTGNVSVVNFVKRPEALGLHTTSHLAVVGSERADALGLLDLRNGESQPRYFAVQNPGRVVVSERFDLALVLAENGRRLHLVPLPQRDTTPPIVTPPGDLTIEATAVKTPVDLGAATAEDETDGPLPASVDTRGPFPLGSHVVTWTAVDTSGNVGSATQIVVVQDTTPPALIVPDDVLVTSAEPIAVDIGVPSVVDIFAPLSVSNDAPPLFPLGATTVTWTVTDPSGNVSTGVQLVTVEAPVPQRTKPLFLQKKFLTGGRSPAASMLADLDGDGHLDAAVANANSGDVSVVLGNGDGTFGNATSFAVGVAPNAIASADMNGDSIVDLVTANLNDDDVSVLLGRGDGTFEPESRYPAGAGPNSIAVADLDGNGAPDVVTANRDTFELSVLLGTGDGSLAPGQPLAARFRPEHVTLTDLNGDGTIDVIAASRLTLHLFLGDGAGGFGEEQTQSVGSFIDALTTSDLDGDGRRDVLITKRFFTNGELVVFLGNGDGTLESPVGFPVGGFPSGIALGDLDGDDSLDAAVSLSGGPADPGSVSVLLGNGDGTFGPPKVWVAGGHPMSVHIGDIDEDGRADVIATNRDYADISVLRGKGNGRFVVNETRHVHDLHSAVALADLNGDANLDVVTSSWDPHRVSVYLGGGDGTIGEQKGFFAGERIEDVKVADVDRDGATDIVTANESSHDFSVLKGRGDGTFEPELRFAVGSFASGVAVGDVNADLAPDVVAARKTEDDVSVHLGDGAGGFGAPSFFPVGDLSHRLILVDVNADTRLDVVTVSSQIRSVSVLLGNGDGTFADERRAPVGTGTTLPYWVAAGELNGDGHMDLVTGNRGGYTLLFGNGDGTFQPPRVNDLSLAGEWGLAVIDLDDDGHLDLVLGSRSSAHVSVLLGRGDGTFKEEQRFTAGKTMVALAAGDLNGDLRPDVITVNGRSLTLLIQSGVNRLPVADAGPDQAVPAGLEVRLDGGGSDDPDGVIETFAWRQTAGPPLSLAGADEAVARFIVPDLFAVTDATFELTVTDEDGETATDEATITLLGRDTTPPVVTPPSHRTVQATAILTAVVLGTASAVDDVDGPLEATPDQLGPFPLGAHTITWSATDRSGNTGTAIQTITVVDTRPPNLLIPPGIDLLSFEPAPVDIGTATATDIFEPVAITNDAPDIFPIGTTLVTWRAEDANGNVATRLQIVTLRALELSVAEPSNGATVNGREVLFRGEILGPVNTGVMVGGVPAIVDGTTFYALVPLSKGSNTFEVRGTTPSGHVDTERVTVTREGDPLFSVVAMPAAGLPPLDVEFFVEPAGLATPTLVSIDFDGDGVFDESTTDLSAPLSHRYETAETFVAEVVVTDVIGVEHRFSRPVHVVDLVSFNTMILSVWSPMIDALEAGQVDAAVQFIDPERREVYREAFLARAAELPAFLASFPDIHPVRVSDRDAEYLVLLPVAGTETGFFIYFVKSVDGVWRLLSM